VRVSPFYSYFSVILLACLSDKDEGLTGIKTLMHVISNYSEHFTKSYLTSLRKCGYLEECKAASP
jgi:hypothetical protein